MLEKLKKPTEVQPTKPKFMISGESGVGKSMFALNWPSPVLIDTESGSTRAQYQNKLKASGGVYFGKDEGSQSFDEVIKLIKSLTTETHPYKTLIIDSFTHLYLLAAAEAEMRYGNDFGKDKKMANMPTRQLLSLLEKIDMSVIIICHSKVKWEKHGKEVVDGGTTFDGYDKMSYILDLWIEILKGGKTFNIKKSRIESLPQGDSMPLSYDKFIDVYGREIIEKESIPVLLATPEQVARLQSLVEGLKVDQETQDKWLSKCGVDSYVDMTNTQIDSLIQFCEKKILSLSMVK